MGGVWSSCSPAFAFSVITSVCAVIFTAIFAYRTSKHGSFLCRFRTPQAAGAVDGHSADEPCARDNELCTWDDERIPAKPQAAKAAESLIEAAMTEEQKTLEKEAQRKQLEAIYRLMAQHSDKFGDTSMEEIVDQMALYRR
ncbi:uncharacterized protein LOC144147270 [Haemaphysalis longicornis]